MGHAGFSSPDFSREKPRRVRHPHLWEIAEKAEAEENRALLNPKAAPPSKHIIHATVMLQK